MTMAAGDSEVREALNQLSLHADPAIPVPGR
jgi:hypothetical protein